MKRIGFIINPIAGMGGKVALKGTDGDEILQEAIKRGATPITIPKAKFFFEGIINLALNEEIEFILPQGEMGEKLFNENPVLAEKIQRRILSQIPIKTITTSIDTNRVAKELKGLKVDLIIFVGGDGTAQDIFTAIGSKTPILGIPSGVKIHSGVFAQSTSKAIEIVKKFVNNQVEFTEVEIIDLDEDAFRKGILNTRLYGIGLVPQIPSLMQLTKSSTIYTDQEKDNIQGIIRTLRKEISQNTLYLLGSGSTIKDIAQAFGNEIYLNKTLLGIDIVYHNNLIKSDVSEREILYTLDLYPEIQKKLLITPIGGQGFILGRGNQQLSPNVIEKIGCSAIQVIATKSKIENLQKRVLHIDTGDPDLDKQLTGYQKVLVDYNEYWMIMVD
ncbi:MAG: ATP-NAD kinase family protein [Candidatus Hodarchaeales archaeon]|jgi:predicted polyphosphate/ATP-dependent NAD kinase